MDPVSALGLAGNIIQFIDFGCKLVSKASDIRKNGSVVEYADMMVVTTDLGKYAASLRSQLTQLHTVHNVFPMLSVNEIALLDICTGCVDVCDQLEWALNALELRGTTSKWKSFRQALKTIWSKERIAELQRRLDLYSEQMDRRLLAALSARVEAGLLAQSQQHTDLTASIRIVIERMAQLEDQSKQTGQKVETTGTRCLTAVEDLRMRNTQQHAWTHLAVADLSERAQQHHQETLAVAMNIVDTLKCSLEETKQQHAATLQTVLNSGQEGQKLIINLQDEIRTLKMEVAEMTKHVATVADMSPTETKEGATVARDAKYTLLMAKRLVLDQIQENVSLPIGDWATLLNSVSTRIRSLATRQPAAMAAELDQTDWGTASDIDIDEISLTACSGRWTSPFPTRLIEDYGTYSELSCTWDMVHDKCDSSVRSQLLSGSDWVMGSSSSRSVSTNELSSFVSVHSGSSSAVGPRRRAARRGPLSDVEREAALRARRVGGCIQCRLVKIKCVENLTDPRGWCRNCLRAQIRGNGLPCLRLSFDVSLLFRTKMDFVPFHQAHTMVGPHYGDFVYERLWADCPPVIMDATQVTSSRLSIEVLKFIPKAAEAGTERDYMGRQVFTAPWAITKPDEALAAINGYIDGSTEQYIEEILGGPGNVMSDIFQLARRLSTPPVANSLLAVSLRLWVGCRLTEGGWSCWSFPETSLGAINSKCDLPPYLDYQITSLVTSLILCPVAGQVIRELQKQVMQCRVSHYGPDAWFHLFLSCFVLLHNYEAQMQFQVKVSNLRKSSVLYLDLPLAQNLVEGANIVLTYFHTACKSQQPFAAALEWDTLRGHLRTMASLKPEQVAFLEAVRDQVVSMAAHFESLKHSDRLHEPWWFTSQMFEPDWKPRVPPTSSPVRQQTPAISEDHVDCTAGVPTGDQLRPNTDLLEGCRSPSGPDPTEHAEFVPAESDNPDNSRSTTSVL